MADDGGLGLELADGANIVIRYLLDMLVGKDLRVVLCLLNGFRIIWPARRERGVALRFEQRAPAVPTAGKEPQAVYKHDGLQPRVVGSIDLLLFMGRERCHVIVSPFSKDASAADYVYWHGQFHIIGLFSSWALLSLAEFVMIAQRRRKEVVDSAERSALSRAAR